VSDERVLFDNFMAERFPNVEMDEEIMQEFYDVWLNGYKTASGELK